MAVNITFPGNSAHCRYIRLWDAKHRSMNPLLWALAVLLIPGLVGLIIYLIVASQHKPLLKCPSCGYQVEQHFQVCPQCGFQLKDACPQCNQTVSPDWQVCAHCGYDLKNHQSL